MICLVIVPAAFILIISKNKVKKVRVYIPVQNFCRNMLYICRVKIKNMDSL